MRKYLCPTDRMRQKHPLPKMNMSRKITLPMYLIFGKRRLPLKRILLKPSKPLSMKTRTRLPVPNVPRAEIRFLQGKRKALLTKRTERKTKMRTI